MTSELTVLGYTAFAGDQRIGHGALAEVAGAVWHARQQDAERTTLVFDARGAVVDLDLRGNLGDVVARYAPAEKPSRGRPKLGVVAREVTLLPRHWDWLATQPGGASAALRRMVETASKAEGQTQRVRLGREAAYRFMSAMAGDRAGFEEASRALFAGDRKALARQTATWPRDIVQTVEAYLEGME